jgi:hypothetical protein
MRWVMREEIVDALAEEARRLDEVNYEVADVLDVKASIILVALTFLGTLTGEILVISDLPATIRVIQIIAVIALSIAGILTIATLWPRHFDIPPNPQESAAYAEALREHFDGAPDAEDLVLRRFQKTQMELTLARIVTNNQLASSKSRFNRWAFYAVGVSVLAELASLLWLAFWHLHL